MSSSSKIFNSSITALLDIDQTLLLGISDYREDGSCYIPETSINKPLLAALKQARILSLYLFTDMTFSKSMLAERNALVALLATNGFDVKGVITPADCCWNLNENDLEQFSQFVYVNKILNDLAAANQIRENSFYQSLSLNFRAELASHSSSKLGQAFLEQENAEALKKSILAKYFIDARSIERKLAHPKGVMFDFFLCHRPEALEVCIVCDDVAEVLTSVHQVNEKHSVLKIKLVPLHVNKNTNYPAFTADILQSTTSVARLAASMNSVIGHQGRGQVPTSSNSLMKAFKFS